ncbi:pre-mRNA-processing protein 40C-like isoform X1 [Coffea arabica]|uniref:Pre-mRNA-processing protein 40C-like isoform X1 n=1 Tax=Coffea arabica TaxID=13443 RepID=A0ABM4W6J2_COFAR
MSQNPSTCVPGVGVPSMMAGAAPPTAGGLQQGAPMNASNFTFNGNAQLGQINQSVKPNNKAEVVQELEGVSTAQPTPTSNLSSSFSGVPPAPSYQVLPGFANSPATPPPGISPSIPLPANVAVTPSSDLSTAFLRPNNQSILVLSNPPVQHQRYAPYPSVSPAAASLRGPWLQPPQVSGLIRPPFSAYPVAITGPFPLPARNTPIPSVPLLDTQAPGVTNAEAPSATPIHTVASVSQSTTGVLQAEIPPGIDNVKSANAVDIKDGSPANEHLEAWTAHRTETGALYYYNAVTGESTYEKPSGFVGEPEKVTAQPTPVTWEKLAGTDWTLVTTNDGKKYYYNTKTKLSSWQIPSELTELKKKQDADASRTSMAVSSSSVLSEKGSTPIALSAPAITTGGRDATVLRSSTVVGPSSALDLIKKKLQDSGVPPATSPGTGLPGAVSSDPNGSKLVEARDSRSDNSKENVKETNGESNLSDTSSDSEDDDNGPRKEECIIQFKEMLKERGVAPFSKWEKELPKIFYDPRFKAIPSHSARRALFEHYVRTRAEEQRKERRAAQKAAVEGFKKLLEEVKEDIDDQTDYQTFKKKWGHDPRFVALERKEREALLNERILPLKRAAEEKAQAIRAAAISSFKSMLKEGDITSNSRWSKVKDSLRNDPRYKSVKHEDREALFNEYIAELKAAEEETERIAKDKNSEEDKLKERERALRKRKEREEQEVERVRLKARRKEAVESYQALLVESIKDPQASWTESKSKLDKDPQGRAANPNLDQSDLEKLFREHVKILHERCVSEFRALLAEVVTLEAAAREKDGKTVLTSWSTAKHLLKADARYTKMPRKDRESLWKRHVEDIQRRQKSAPDRETEKHKDARNKSSVDSGKNVMGSRTHDKR